MSLRGGLKPDDCGASLWEAIFIQPAEVPQGCFATGGLSQK